MLPTVHPRPQAFQVSMHTDIATGLMLWKTLPQALHFHALNATLVHKCRMSAGLLPDTTIILQKERSQNFQFRQYPVTLVNNEFIVRRNLPSPELSPKPRFIDRVS